MSTNQPHDDGSELELLREAYPEFSFGVVWQAAASGPDSRTLFATLGCVVISDRTAAGLARKLRERE